MVVGNNLLQATQAEARHRVETTAALERQLAAVQAELALAQDQCRQAMLKPNHASCSIQTEAADMQHPKSDNAGMLCCWWCVVLAYALADLQHVILLFLPVSVVIISMTVMTAVLANLEHGNIAGDQEETAAEKKLLRAEVASLKRQAAEQRMSLQMIQHDVLQVKSVFNRCTSDVDAQSCMYSALF